MKEVVAGGGGGHQGQVGLSLEDSGAVTQTLVHKVVLKRKKNEQNRQLNEASNFRSYLYELKKLFLGESYFCLGYDGRPIEHGH